MSEPRKCQGCGSDLPPNKGPGPGRKWCSDLCRKHTLYSANCTVCGGIVRGADRKDAPDGVCMECKIWPDEAVIDAMRRWAESRGGIPPTCEDWRCGGPDHPCSRTVTRRANWNEMLLRAGFALKCDRRPETQTWVEEQIRGGRTLEDVADAIGVTPAAISGRLRYRGTSVAAIRAGAR